MTHSSLVIILMKKNPVGRRFVLSRTPIKWLLMPKLGILNYSP